MIFKFFLGVTGRDELKKKFRELAHSLHPDKGGTTSEFQAMVAEYQKIQSDGFITYPITNGGNSGSNRTGEYRKAANNNQNYWQSTWEEVFSGFAKQEAYAKAKAEQQRRDRQAAEDLAEKQRRAREAQSAQAKRASEDSMWFLRMHTDPIYNFIKNLIDGAIHETRTANWLLMEVYKIEELELSHFKFVKWYMESRFKNGIELDYNWAEQSYKGYIHVWSIKWQQQ